MSTISIIGSGGMARAIGARAAGAGHTVEVISRDETKARELAAQLAEPLGSRSDGQSGGTVAGTYGAAPAGDIVVLAVPYASAAAVASSFGQALAGKVVIDISNAFNADATALVTPEGTSGAQQLAEALPVDARVVKAFNTVFGHVLAKGAPLDVFTAGDDAAAKASVSDFIESLGLRPFDAGDLSAAQWLEAAGPLLMALAGHGAGFDISFRLDTAT